MPDEVVAVATSRPEKAQGLGFTIFAGHIGTSEVAGSILWHPDDNFRTKWQGGQQWVRQKHGLHPLFYWP